MLFNSIDFALFLPIVFILDWFITKGDKRAQNILLLGASYFFYACWDWRFLFILIFSTYLDYFTGIKINSGSGLNKLTNVNRLKSDLLKRKNNYIIYH